MNFRTFIEHSFKILLFQRINDDREARKRDPDLGHIMPICHKILQFGDCQDSWSCKKRHVFTDNDKSVNIPCDGLVKFDIIAVRNPSHLSIKISEFLPAGEKFWISREKQNLKIEDALNSLQEILNDNAVMQVPIKVDDICGVFYPKAAKWCRCRVLDKQ